jgi:hypothetical protein
MQVKIDGDAVYKAMAKFRIHHMLSDERAKEIGEKDLKDLWLTWRIDNGLPLKKAEWEVNYDCYEALMFCLDVYLDGRSIGHVDLVGPPSPELEALLKKTAKAA